jgi:hypothetical protein
MKPYLSKAAVQLREQIDDNFADRSRKSDGWISDARHQKVKSDHNALPSGEVCAIDITADLGKAEGMSAYLADQIRIAGKTDKRIKYVIHNHHIASKLLNWRWRKYKGINPHTKHIHISFYPKQTGEFFNIPLLGGKA